MPTPPKVTPWEPIAPWRAIVAKKRRAAERAEQRAAELRAQADEIERERDLAS